MGDAVVSGAWGEARCAIATKFVSRESSPWVFSHLECDQSLGVLLGRLERGSLAEVRLVPIGLELDALLRVRQRLSHLAQLEEGGGAVGVDWRQLRVAGVKR